MGHVVLLGDSIFDNASYVPGGPAVIDHLTNALPSGWQATLAAIDGSVVADVPRQLRKLPADATHLVLSVGGNNALPYGSYILHVPAESVAEVATRLGEIRAQFRQEYRELLSELRALGLPTTVCTIYESIPILSVAEQTGLALFNEVILAEAVRTGTPVVDLRLICTEAGDYAESSPIEPSVAGGWKIAQAVARVIGTHDFTAGECRVYL